MTTRSFSLSRFAPTYVSRFSCTGGDCPDTCCQGLTIGLTEDEVVRLRRGPGTAAFFAAVNEEIKPPPEGGPAGVAAVLSHPHGACSFLDEERLCSVQKTLGVEALNEVCREYPRQANTVGNRIEIVGALGCPEMARLCLTADDALTEIPSAEKTRPRSKRRADPTRVEILKVLQRDDLDLAVRFLGVALALDASAHITDVSATLEALFSGADERVPRALEESVAVAPADGTLRASLGSDALMARRPASDNAHFAELVDRAVFTSSPGVIDLSSFFAERSAKTRSVAAMAARITAHHQKASDKQSAAFALAASRYAGWRWMSASMDSLQKAKQRWGRILIEIAAAEVLLSADADLVEAFQKVARELTTVPTLEPLLDAYTLERGLDTLLGQAAAGPHSTSPRPTAPGARLDCADDVKSDRPLPPTSPMPEA